MQRSEVGVPPDVLVGRNIRDLRVSHALAAEELAGRIGLPAARLGLIEAGAVRACALTLIMLAQGLGVPPSTLLPRAPDGSDPA